MRKPCKRRRRKREKKDEAQQAIGLSDQQVLAQAEKTLSTHLPLSLDGKQYGETEIFDVVLWASAKTTSIDDACQQLSEAPSANTVRNAIKTSLLEEIQTLENQLNNALTCQLPRRIMGHRHKVACDLVFIPYHGKPHSKEEEIKRSQAKSGTTHFHCYSTAYVIKNNKRVTLALTYVRADDSLVDVVARLFTRLAKLDISYRRLLLDKGFYSVAILQYLLEKDLPFVIPVVHRGRSGGSRCLCTGERSYQTSYTMTSKTSEVTFDVIVIRKYSKGRYKRKGVVWFAYAVNRFKHPIHSVYDEYRLRFGIESSYRLMNRCRARTSSRNPAYRLLLVGIAFILLNIWVYLCWNFVCCRCQGGRYLPKGEFRLQRFLAWIVSRVDEIYHLIRNI